ncbi:hypothetical protein PM082_007166 [Marasmius tenuissimus]|nr:hypothetical protein PM082_007166 [Marasmius tenuissimus]
MSSRSRMLFGPNPGFHKERKARAQVQAKHRKPFPHLPHKRKRVCIESIYPGGTTVEKAADVTAEDIEDICSRIERLLDPRSDKEKELPSPIAGLEFSRLVLTPPLMDIYRRLVLRTEDRADEALREFWTRVTKEEHAAQDEAILDADEQDGVYGFLLEKHRESLHRLRSELVKQGVNPKGDLDSTIPSSSRAVMVRSIALYSPNIDGCFKDLDAETILLTKLQTQETENKVKIEQIEDELTKQENRLNALSIDLENSLKEGIGESSEDKRFTSSLYDGSLYGSGPENEAQLATMPELNTFILKLHMDSTVKIQESYDEDLKRKDGKAQEIMAQQANELKRLTQELKEKEATLQETIGQANADISQVDAKREQAEKKARELTRELKEKDAETQKKIDQANSQAQLKELQELCRQVEHHLNSRESGELAPHPAISQICDIFYKRSTDDFMNLFEDIRQFVKTMHENDTIVGRSELSLLPPAPADYRDGICQDTSYLEKCPNLYPFLWESHQELIRISQQALVTARNTATELQASEAALRNTNQIEVSTLLQGLTTQLDRFVKGQDVGDIPQDHALYAFGRELENALRRRLESEAEAIYTKMHCVIPLVEGQGIRDTSQEPALNTFRQELEKALRRRLESEAGAIYTKIRRVITIVGGQEIGDTSQDPALNSIRQELEELLQKRLQFQDRAIYVKIQGIISLVEGQGIGDISSDLALNSIRHELEKALRRRLESEAGMIYTKLRRVIPLVRGQKIGDTSQDPALNTVREELDEALQRRLESEAGAIYTKVQRIVLRLYGGEVDKIRREDVPELYQYLVEGYKNHVTQHIQALDTANREATELTSRHEREKRTLNETISLQQQELRTRRNLVESAALREHCLQEAKRIFGRIIEYMGSGSEQMELILKTESYQEGFTEGVVDLAQKVKEQHVAGIAERVVLVLRGLGQVLSRSGFESKALDGEKDIHASVGEFWDLLVKTHQLATSLPFNDTTNNARATINELKRQIQGQESTTRSAQQSLHRQLNETETKLRTSEFKLRLAEDDLIDAKDTAKRLEKERRDMSEWVPKERFDSITRDYNNTMCSLNEVRNSRRALRAELQLVRDQLGQPDSTESVEGAVSELQRQLKVAQENLKGRSHSCLLFDQGILTSYAGTVGRT